MVFRLNFTAALVVYVTTMINYVFISFPTVQIDDSSYTHLHFDQNYLLGYKTQAVQIGGGLMPVSGEFSVNLSVNNGMSNYL